MVKKKQTEEDEDKELRFEKTDSKFSEEYLVYDGDDYLGTIIKYSSTNAFHVKHIGAHPQDYSIDHKGLSITCPSKDDAGRALYAMKYIINNTPLSDEMRQYFEEENRLLYERKKQIVGELYSLDRKRGWLAQFAKKYGLDMRFEGDMKKEVADLVKFMDESNDDLYKHMGKTFARDLRAFVASVVRIVDPDAAKDL